MAYENSKVNEIANKVPVNDVETKAEQGKPTSAQADDNKIPASTAISAANSVAGNAGDLVNSSVSLATDAISGAVGIAGGAVGLAAQGLSDTFEIAGIAMELGQLVITEGTSYIVDATTKIALAGVSYTAKMATDTAKKTVSYVGDMLKINMPSISDLLTPVDVKVDLSKQTAKLQEKAAKIAEKTQKVQEATKKVNDALGTVQDKISYLSMWAEDGPDKLRELGTDIIYSAISYVGDVRDKVITGIADWEEKTSNVIAYNIASNTTAEQIDKITKQLKKAVDELNKIKTQAVIIAKMAIAVAISKVCALIGL